MITPIAMSEQSTSGYIIHPPSVKRVISENWVPTKANS
jgi:hypothetical protein